MIKHHKLGNIFKNLFLTDNKPLREVSRYIESKNDVSVVLFGDSVSKRIAREDRDNRTLQKMTEQELSIKKVSANYFSGKGFHLRLFMHFISAMRKNDKKPDLVVIPLNLRCFSPQWMYHPRWQFEKDLRIFCKKFMIPCSIPVTKFPDTAAEYWKMPMSCHGSNHSTIGDFMKIIKKKEGLDEKEALFRKQQLFIFHYLYKLSSDNDRLSSLNTLVKENNYNLLLYFTPLNYSGGEALLGGAFSAAVEENKKIIMQTVVRDQAMKNVVIKDYSKLFDADYFFSKHDPTEHLNEAGRKKLSKLLTEEIDAVISSK